MRGSFFVLMVLMTIISFSQKTRVNLKHADRATGTTIKGEAVNKLYGRVHLQKDNVDFFCDSAIRFTRSNDFKAYGHVKMIQGDSITLVCDKLLHKGLTGVSRCRDNVVLSDGKMILKTDKLDFDKRKSIAYYYDVGKVYDGGVFLISEKGFYSTNSKIFRFNSSVEITKDRSVINSDTVRYNRVSEIIYFQGPTTILSSGDSLYAEKGQYHTKTDDAYFSKNAFVETPDYILRGDSVWYNNYSENGYVEGHAVIHSKKDSVYVMGDIGEKNADLGKVKVYGPQTLLQKYDKKDTIFIMADTLLTIEDSLKQQSEIYAYNNVKIRKGNISGLSDSLLYALKDSTIYFFDNPVVWADSNQISGDTIRVLFANQEIHKIFTSRNSFTIKFHHHNQHDQIKGRNTVAFFHDSELAKVKMYGNGECLYYVNNEEEKEFTGVNIIECSSMNVYFNEGQLSDISFVTSPKARFYPPKGLTKDKKFLEKFDWRWANKPTRQEFEEVIGIYFPSFNKINVEVKVEIEASKEIKKSKEKKSKAGKRLFKKKRFD